MYKKITEGLTLTITGENLYSGNTQVFFNSTDFEVPVIGDSFNSDNTQVSVRVPNNLPDTNEIIIYNGVDYVTGDLRYKFLGFPEISGLSEKTIRQGDDTVLDGKYLLGTTGVTIDGQQASYYAEGPNRIVVTAPVSLLTGDKDLVVHTSAGSAQTGVIIYETSMEGELGAESSASGLKFGESGRIVNGKSLHRVNRILISGYSNQINLNSGSNGFITHGNTGITFRVPSGALNGYPVTMQQDEGYFLSGDFIPNIKQEHATSSSLKIRSPYVSKISTSAAKYQEPITISGSQIENCKILFQGHNTGNTNYIEANTLSTGINTISVEMPRGVIRSQLIASGYTGDTNDFYTSEEYIYPIPTITGISPANWTVGSQVEIQAVNASEARALVGASGYDYLSTVLGAHIVSAPADFSPSSTKHFGTASIDHSSLEANMPESIQTGVSKITAVINASIVGTTNPFLVSIHDGGTLNSLDSFGGVVQNVSPFPNSVKISGKAPQVYGLSKERASKKEEIQISGSYLLTAERLDLKSSTETKSLTVSQFENASGIDHEKIDFLETGVNTNYYDQVHIVTVDLEDFNFSGKNGVFEFVTPSI